MPRNLFSTCISLLLTFCVFTVGVLGFSSPSQAVDVETQDYFVKHLVKDKVLSVSPNFQGELTQAILLPSLKDISDEYHIKATKSIEAEKLNGKLVPGLIVYVEPKSTSAQLGSTLASLSK